NPLTATDLRELDILGWTLASSAPPPAQADLSVSNLALSATSAGVNVSFHVDNTGTGSAGASTAGIYLSSSSTITTSNTLLGTTSTPALGAGGSDGESVTLSLSAPARAGTYYIGVIADSGHGVAESNEGNNTAAIPIILGSSTGSNTLYGTAGNDIIVGF